MEQDTYLNEKYLRIRCLYIENQRISSNITTSEFIILRELLGETDSPTENPATKPTKSFCQGSFRFCIILSHQQQSLYS